MRVNSDTHPNRYANRLQHPPLWGRLLVLCAVILSVCCTPASAVSSSINVRAASASAATLGDPMELEAFIDSVVNKQLEELHIAGAVVVIVKDGQVLLSKGYGSADLEKQIPVNADTTLFLPGSVTKLFTWTAVMQLVEQGKIDLQADVNTYLTTFKIQANYPQPITMLDLMAHTSGFEETTEGILTPKSEELTSLETYLAQHMPRRVYPPGQVPAYSNYGAALAGYIVEQVSGESYEQYIENHILIPLGMEHSSMHQPLPAHLAQDISLGYLYSNGKYVLLPINWIQASPAGALSATGADMGRFMLAHLQDGQYNNVHILKPETARLMHKRSYTFDPALPGWAHGFEESSINGQRLIGHGGTHLFNTLLELIPDKKVGFYASYNAYLSSSSDEDAITHLLAAFMDRYFPAPSESQPAVETAYGSAAQTSDADLLKRCSGFYTSSRSILSNPEKLQSLYSMFWIRSRSEGILERSYVLGFIPEDTWIAVRPLVFKNTSTGELAIFKEDGQGTVQYLSFSDEPNSFIKQPWYSGQIFQFVILAFSLLTFLLTLIAALVGFFISLRKQAAGRHSSWQERLARGAVLALCLAFIIFVAIFTQYMGNENQSIIIFLAWLIAALALSVLLLSAAAWWKSWWSLWGRLHYSTVALAGAAITWFLAYWSVLIQP